MDFFFLSWFIFLLGKKASFSDFLREGNYLGSYMSENFFILSYCLTDYLVGFRILFLKIFSFWILKALLHSLLASKCLCGEDWSHLIHVLLRYDHYFFLSRGLLLFSFFLANFTKMCFSIGLFLSNVPYIIKDNELYLIVILI